jgi:hypothetical protein
MRLFTVSVFTALFFLSCSNSKKSFENYIIGDWQIENPTLQSFIRFEAKGEVTFFFNRFSYEKDSLAQYGKWILKDLKQGVAVDTFLLEIQKPPRNTEFKILILNQKQFKAYDDLGYTRFTRIEN